jgi:hypothetical protein
MNKPTPNGPPFVGSARGCGDCGFTNPEDGSLSRSTANRNWARLLAIPGSGPLLCSSCTCCLNRG